MGNTFKTALLLTAMTLLLLVLGQAFGGQRGQSEIRADAVAVLGDDQVGDSCRNVKRGRQYGTDVSATGEEQNTPEVRSPHRIYRLRS